MKKTVQILVLFLVLFACSKDDDSTTEQDSTIEDFLDETVSDNDIPGIIAAIIDSDGIIEIATVGVRKIDSPELLTIDDQIHLGSCTKAMTSTLLAVLVKENLITWDTKFIDVFPELEIIIDESFHDVTLHNLVTHRGGIPTNATDWWMSQDLEIKERRLEIIKANLDEPSGLTLGDYNYSNLGYMIAGSMAEKITGSTWEDLMTEKFFTPLGMSSAGFGVPGNLNMVDQPWGHYKENGNWQSIQADNPEALGPAGTVHASFQDWAKFLSLQLSADDQDLLNQDELDFLVDPIEDYASGWNVLDRSWANGTVFNHSGSNTLWFVNVWVAPELDRAFLVGTNSYDGETFGLTDQVISELITYDQDL